MADFSRIWTMKISWDQKLVLIALARGFKTREEIMHATGFSDSELFETMAKLSQAGLVAQTDGRWTDLSAAKAS